MNKLRQIVIDAPFVPFMYLFVGWTNVKYLDTELREFKNYIFQSLLETCNQELNASFLYCNRSQCI